ncbi:MAG: hypothetical protein D6722_20890 [Bacteroidetes bacterium]|nr:MAG: hypothetical protein D6722_20890 [Bacteroidota bacterium]
MFLFALLWTGMFGAAWAQPVQNVRAEALGDSVRITYRLNDADPDRLFTVAVAALRGSDTLLLERVKGGVGDSLRVGTHEIMWDARTEWERFRGPVRFLILATPAFGFIAPAKPVTLKRDKPYTFKWFGGNSTLDSLQLDLYQYDKLIGPVAQVGQKGQYTWKVPAGLKPGEGYRIKLTGTELSGLEAFSPDFAVIRKVPMYILIGAPAAFVTGLGTFLLLARRPLPGPPGDPSEPGNPTYQTDYPVPR